MKKILALTLAAVMTAGMTTVAFAVDAEEIEIGTNLLKYDSDKGYGVPIAGEGSFSDLIPGATYYISLENEGGDTIDANNTVEITKSLANKYKVYAEWKVGEIEDLKIDYKKVDLVNGETGYRYVVVVEVPDVEDAKAYDVAGEIKVAKSKTAAKNADAFNLDATVGDYTTISSDSIDATDLSLVKFDKDAELTDVEITWGDDEVAMFEVNVSGQGKLNLAYNVDFNKEFAAKYDYANIDFLTFEGTPSFNRTGKLYIYADADTYLYEVTEDGAKAVKAEYDEDYEAWVLNTRTLKAYAISDVELDEQTVTEDKDDSSKTEDNTGKPNPDTGR